MCCHFDVTVFKSIESPNVFKGLWYQLEFCSAKFSFCFLLVSKLTPYNINITTTIIIILILGVNLV